MLGLASNRNIVVSNYSKPIEVVLEDTVRSTVGNEQSLDIIVNISTPQPMKNLPSWVPDFTSTSNSMNSFTDYSFLVSKKRAFLEPEVVGILSTKGFILDIVNGLGSAFNVCFILYTYLLRQKAIRISLLTGLVKHVTN